MWVLFTLVLFIASLIWGEGNKYIQNKWAYFLPLIYFFIVILLFQIFIVDYLFSNGFVIFMFGLLLSFIPLLLWKKLEDNIQIIKGIHYTMLLNGILIFLTVVVFTILERFQ